MRSMTNITGFAETCVFKMVVVS